MAKKKPVKTSESDSNKTVGPDQTVISSPEIAPTMQGGDTVEDVDPQATIQPGKTPPTIKEAPAEQGSVETFISDPDVAGQAATDEESADHATQQTFLSEPDHTQDTIIGQKPTNPEGKKDLEDHYETLIEDTNAPAQSPDGKGGMVIGDYQVLSELGRGGMGVVYKARHRKLNRIVAIKMILAGNHAGNEALERFITEARAVAHLQHPGIVQIFDIGEHNGLPYFSLEYVEGSDLQKKLDRQPQDPVYAAKMVEKLARAMHYAHENNILHRDIKPPNVLLDAQGEPKITDFGLAKQVDDEEASTGTTAGTIMGSPSYMPPEQARGEISSVTPRSDLYSLGAVLYEMITGRPPFLAKKPLETVMQVVNIDPVSPRDLQPGTPTDLETICLKAMQKDQAARYANCDALADDLKRFINREPIQARPISKLERLAKWCRRNPKIAVPSGLAVSAIALTAVVALWAWQTTSAQAAIIADERDEADKQRKVAVVAKEDAEKQRFIAVKAQKQAEENLEVARTQTLLALKNIQFVLTKVDSELRGKPGMSDIRLAVLEAVSTKWDEIDVELSGGEEGEAAATRMAIRKLIAEIFADLDKLAEADGEYSKLFDAGQKRVDIKKRSDSSRDNLAQIARDWASIKKRATNDPRESIKLLELATALIDEIFEDPRPEPGSPVELQLRNTRGTILQNTAREYLYSGELGKAVEKFRAALEDNQAIVDAIPSDPQFKDNPSLRERYLKAFRQNVDQSKLGVGYVELRRGKTSEALKLYDASIAGRRAQFEKTPEDLTTIATLGGFLNIYGGSLLWIERLEEAEKFLTEALKLNTQAHQLDTKLAAKTRTLALNHYRLATLRAMQGDSEAAATEAEAARALYAPLFEQSDDRKNKINLMLAEAKCGNTEAAAKLVGELGETEIEDPEIHLDRSRALALLATFAESDEDKTNFRSEALTALEKCVADGYLDAFRISREYDLKSLREEPRFKAIVTKLSQPE